jgi:hypothetical protein
MLSSGWASSSTPCGGSDFSLVPEAFERIRALLDVPALAA